MVGISVIVPCYNEAGNINELHRRLSSALKRLHVDFEFVYVNDASVDRTYAELSEIGEKNKNVIVVDNQVNYGMARSWRIGLERSHGNLVVLIDADLQYQPEDIVRLFGELMYRRVDLVQGFRSSVGRLRDSRFILSKGLNFLLNSFFNMNARDNKSGFIITRREVLQDIFATRFNYIHPQTFILVSAVAKGYSYSEIEVLFTERLVGKSFIAKAPIKLVISVLADLARALYEFRISKKNITILTRHVNTLRPVKGAPDRSLYKKLLLWLYFHTMPLHAWMLTRNVKTYYRELSASQWFSREEILALQLEKLKAIVSHAYYHVSYYRDLFDEVGLKPEDVKTLSDLKKIPYLTKSIVTDNLHFGMIADNQNKSEMLKIVTSGSTGVPFTCYADRYQLEMRWAATLRSMEWTGYVFGDRCARLWHQTIGMTSSQVIREIIDSFLSRRIFIPAYSISSKKIRTYLSRLEKWKPVLIDGYAESFNFLASYVKAGVRLEISPKAIISSAQILPEDSRYAIEQAFDTVVYDKYGSREFSGIAYEAGEKDIHLVVAENYIVEIIKSDRDAAPGELGEIVVTDLNNKCMPFLRYKIGDLAVAVDPDRKSKCGRGLPLIGRVEGRVQAIIICDNRTYLPGTFFAHFFKEYQHCITQYQVVQNALGSIVLKIVKGDRFSQAQFDEVIARLRGHVGQEIEIDIQFLKEIPMVRTGKHQGAISNIGIDFQKIDNYLKSDL